MYVRIFWSETPPCLFRSPQSPVFTSAAAANAYVRAAAAGQAWMAAPGEPLRTVAANGMLLEEVVVHHHVPVEQLPPATVPKSARAYSCSSIFQEDEKKSILVVQIGLYRIHFSKVSATC